MKTALSAKTTASTKLIVINLNNDVYNHLQYIAEKRDPRRLPHKVSTQPCYFLSWVKQVKIKPGENVAKSRFKFNGKSKIFILKTIRERYTEFHSNAKQTTVS